MKKTSSPLDFRLCTIADLDLLTDISKKTFEAAFEKDNNPEDFKNYVETAFSRERLLTEMENEESFFYFVYSNQDLVGYFKLNLESAQTDVNDSNSIELERVYVLAAYQGMGIGASILEEVLRLARAKSLVYVWLGVWEHNPGAIRFYQRYGFKKFSTHSFYIGQDKQTDWLLRLDL